MTTDDGSYVATTDDNQKVRYIVKDGVKYMTLPEVCRLIGMHGRRTSKSKVIETFLDLEAM